MFKRVIYIFVLVFTCAAFGQNYTKHTVAKGETITQIAQKYKVTPYDIYKLNPDSQNGIQPDAILLIPKSVGKVEVKSDSKPKPKPVVFSKSEEKSHKVEAKETLYSISKQYNVSIEDLENANPFLKTDGLQPGQVLRISKYEEPPKMAPNSKMFTLHEVQPKETKYGIATKYGITVEELEKQNPSIVDVLPIGSQLKIYGKSNTVVAVKENDDKQEVVQEKPKVKAQNLLEYTVKNGETLYSLTRQFGISQEKLTALNPQLVEGVKEGMVLKLPATLTFAKENKSSYANLGKSLSKQNKKELVLLLPFNISKIESDTLTTISNRLKKDKFLNMTLDFYAGALMAIDSAKTLGLNIDVQIYDSQETKSSSNAIAIVQNNAKNADVIIGPFYQNNVEKVAEFLEEKNIPVISPLSKDYEKSYKNLYQSTPSNDLLKEAMFDFMKTKNGNIIGVIDPKKSEIKEYILENQKEVKLVGLTEKGAFASDSIKKHFVADRMNYVLMESENYYTITATLKALEQSMKTFQVQLVILEPNEMLDYDEIALSRLTKVKLMYPSLYKENETVEAVKFEKAFKKKNKVLPNQYATRGFDLTLDTMLRLSQDKSFQETIQLTATEQVENKFDYTQKVAGGFSNKGIYILYYDTDLTIKQAE